MAWIYPLAAGLFEVGFTTFLKLSEGFTKLLPSHGFLVFSAISFWLLTIAAKAIPLGAAYAVWTGMGPFDTAIVGILFFGDPISLLSHATGGDPSLGIESKALFAPSS